MRRVHPRRIRLLRQWTRELYRCRPHQDRLLPELHRLPLGQELFLDLLKQVREQDPGGKAARVPLRQPAVRQIEPKLDRYLRWRLPPPQHPQEGYRLPLQSAVHVQRAHSQGQ
jgi:hypothetical protein